MSATRFYLNVIEHLQRRAGQVQVHAVNVRHQAKSHTGRTTKLKADNDKRCECWTALISRHFFLRIPCIHGCTHEHQQACYSIRAEPEVQGGKFIQDRGCVTRASGASRTGLLGVRETVTACLRRRLTCRSMSRPPDSGASDTVIILAANLRPVPLWIHPRTTAYPPVPSTAPRSYSCKKGLWLRRLPLALMREGSVAATRLWGQVATRLRLGAAGAADLVS